MAEDKSKEVVEVKDEEMDYRGGDYTAPASNDTKKILRDGIAMIISGLVMILGYCGVNIPFLTDTSIGQIATVVAFVIVYIANHYFNHNYTKEAKKAQELTDMLKSEGKEV